MKGSSGDVNMNTFRILYEALKKKKSIKYSYQTNQLLQLFNNDLDPSQKKNFTELIDRIYFEQNNLQYYWYLEGIKTAKNFYGK